MTVGSLLSLDLGSVATGWTLGPVESLAPEFGTWEFKGVDNIGALAEMFDNELSVKLGDLRAGLPPPHHVVFEAPILPKETQIATTRKLQGLAWHVEFLCNALRFDCMEAQVSSVKRLWAGNGFAAKETMVAAAKRRGFDVKNHDEADALAVRYFAISGQWPSVYMEIAASWPASVLVSMSRSRRSRR